MTMRRAKKLATGHPPAMCLAFVAALALTAPAGAAPVVFTGQLKGSSEIPPTASAATGSAIITLDVVAKTMRVQADFFSLVAANTAAHIHCCIAQPTNVGVATVTPTFTGFPSGVTNGTYDHTFDMTLAASYNPAFVTSNGGTAASAFAALAAGIAGGQAYFNIHTTSFPGGEIRGVLIPAPTLQSNVSRKAHGGAGTFNLPLAP